MKEQRTDTLYYKTKTASPKKTIFKPKNILPNLKKKFFHFFIKQLFSGDPTM